MSCRVLVIIPAYNEAETIVGVIEDLREAAPNYDILVVDDGSYDTTAEVVESLGAATLIVLPFNLGIGGAMQTGFKYALRNGYDIAVQCDADGQHPAGHVCALVERVRDRRPDVASILKDHPRDEPFDVFSIEESARKGQTFEIVLPDNALWNVWEFLIERLERLHERLVIQIARDPHHAV